jgi:hypothetical protein
LWYVLKAFLTDFNIFDLFFADFIVEFIVLNAPGTLDFTDLEPFPVLVSSG